MPTLNPVVAEVTARIVERSRATRSDYLRRMDAAAASGVARAKLSCANWAHAFAGQPVRDKLVAMGGQPVEIKTVRVELAGRHRHQRMRTKGYRIVDLGVELVEKLWRETVFVVAEMQHGDRVLKTEGDGHRCASPGECARFYLGH